VTILPTEAQSPQRGLFNQSSKRRCLLTFVSAHRLNCKAAKKTFGTLGRLLKVFPNGKAARSIRCQVGINVKKSEIEPRRFYRQKLGEIL
jgi:hypothetical protein